MGRRPHVAQHKLSWELSFRIHLSQAIQMPSNNETRRLAQLIDDKHDVLVQLRELARRQVQLIANGEISSLINLLSAKQSLLTQVQRIEDDLNPFRSQNPESRNWETAQHRQRTSDVANQCEMLLSEIMLIERQSEANLSSRRDATAARLQSVTKASQARQAYSHAPVNASTRLDISQ